ncbi:MAG: hypothetical protein WAT39_22925 [Planctomycetota bacterium]
MATTTELPLELRVRLRGLHPQAAWTSPITLNLAGRDEIEWLKHRDDETPDERGEATFVLPAWAATATNQEGRLDAADPNYRPLAERWQGALDLSAVRVLEVQVVAVVTGRVVDAAGAPVAAARLTGFAFRNGAPVAPELAQVNTRVDGTFGLVVPPDVSLFVLATPMRAAGRFRPRIDSRNGGVVDTDEIRADLLPAHVLVQGRVGSPTAIPDIVLPTAVVLRGTVRWQDGAAVDLATVQVRPRGGTVFALGEHAHVQIDAGGSLLPGGSATTNAQGTFELPARAGSEVVVAVTRMQEVHLVGEFALPVTPPAPAELLLPRPIRLRARDGARLVPATFHLSTGGTVTATLSGGVEVITNQALRVRASKDRLRSPWVDVPVSAAGTTIDIDLTNELVPLSIEFDGEFRVRNTIVTWRRDDGVSSGQHLGRDDRSGPFQLFLEPGRYHITAGAGGGERNGVFLLPVERDVDLNAGPAELRLPALFGGTFTVTATDSSGVHVGGTCRVYDGGGGDVSAGFSVNGTGRHSRPGELLRDGTNHFTGVLPPGVYELVFEFVHHGTQQQRVTIRPREVSDVRLRLP